MTAYDTGNRKQARLNYDTGNRKSGMAAYDTRKNRKQARLPVIQGTGNRQG